MSANPTPADGGPSVKDTQAELQAVSRKLSSCEAALEGQGSYLGIRDPATLLGQLKTLQKKDEQLREVLLILLRAPPRAPPPAAAVLPPARSTHPPPLSSSAGVALGQQRQQPPSNGSAAARLAPLPSRFPDSSSGRSPAPARTGTGSAKSVSLHDALGIPPPERAAARAGTGPRDGGGGSAGGSSSASPSAAPAQAVTYRHGQHALYRVHHTSAAGGGGGHGSRRGAVGLNASSGAGGAAAGRGWGGGSVSSGTAVRTEQGNGNGACRGEGAASRAAERDWAVPSSSPSTSTSSSSSSSSSASTSAQPSSTGESSTAAPPPAGASSASAASGERASSARVPPLSPNAQVEEGGSGGGGTSSTPKRTSGENQEAAAAALEARMKIKKELVEDMQVGMEDGVSGSICDTSNRWLVESLGAAVAKASAETGMAVAARPRAPGTSPLDLHIEVKKETTEAVRTAVKSIVGHQSSDTLAQIVANRVLPTAFAGFERNFELEEGGGGVKRKAVDRTSRVPRPPRPRAGSDAVRVVETVALDGAGDDEEYRIARPSKPSPSPNDVELLAAEAEPARGMAAAAAADRPPVEAPSVDRPQGGPADGGEEPPHHPGPASLPAETSIPDTAVAHATMKVAARSAAIVSGAGGAVPPERPSRKRRKSAEAGGWRSRYDKNEFESGDALLASSDSESEEGWRYADRRASRNGNGNGGEGDDGTEDAESDELVDVGVEEDDDLGVDGGGGGGGGGAGNWKVSVEPAPIKKRNPPNAWKRRCADGDCLLGASFGVPGQPAKYCSTHKDAGMVNVTHRRCEELGCERQPSFNMPGLRRTRYCGSHKKTGMVNVSSPRCDAEGCGVRPSFGFEGDRRASLCDTHKEAGMVNIRKKSRRSSSFGSNSPRSVVQEDNPVTAAAEAWRCAQLAAAAAASAAGGSSPSFESSFLSDSPSTATAAAQSSKRPDAPALSRFGDDAIGGAMRHGTGVGGGVAQGRGGQRAPGSFLEAVDIAARGSTPQGISFVG